MSEKKNYCNEIDCQGWPGCDCRSPQYWIEYERQKLRDQQARDVMPQIGPLLDAWEGLPADMRHDLREESPALANAMRLIEEAMEDPSTDPDDYYTEMPDGTTTCRQGW